VTFRWIDDFWIQNHERDLFQYLKKREAGEENRYALFLILLR
jgi:hypothetical protein